MEALNVLLKLDYVSQAAIIELTSPGTAKILNSTIENV